MFEKKIIVQFSNSEGFIFEYYFLRAICSNYGIFCGLQSFRKIISLIVG